MKKLLYAAVCGILAYSLTGCTKNQSSVPVSSETIQPSEGEFSGIGYKADPSWIIREEDGQLLLFPEGEQSAASRIVMYYTEADLKEISADEICRETSSVLWEDGSDTYKADAFDRNGILSVKAEWSRQKDGLVQNGTGYVIPVKDTGLIVVQYTYDAETENRFGKQTEEFVRNLVIPQ